MYYDYCESGSFASSCEVLVFQFLSALSVPQGMKAKMLASKELLIRCCCVDCASRAKDALDALVLPSAERQHKQRISRPRRGRGRDGSAAPGFNFLGS